MERLVSMAATLRPARRRVVGPRSDLRVATVVRCRRRRAASTVRVCTGRRCSTSPIAVGLFGVGVVEVLGAELAEDVVQGPTALNLAAVALTTLPLALRREAPFAVARHDLRRDRGARARRRPARDLPAGDRRARRPLQRRGVRDAARRGRGGGRPRARAGDRRRARHRRRRGAAAPAVVHPGGWRPRCGTRRAAPARGGRGRTPPRRSPRSARASPASCTTPSPTASPRSSCRPAARRTSSAATPSAPRRRSASIERAARAGLGEMRRLLGLIGDGAAPREPQPTLAALDRLLRDVREAGLDVEAQVEGDAPPAAAGRRSVRVPHRPGGADQRDEARRAVPRHVSSSATRPMRSRSR